MLQKLIDKQFFLKICALLAASLLAFAFFAEYKQGVTPCILCTFERYVYASLFGASTLSLVYPHKIFFYLVSAIIVSGILLGGYHLGVEWHWWQALESCKGLATTHASFESFQEAFMKKPPARCDQPGWVIFGVSATVWNFIFWLSLFFYSICIYKKSSNYIK